MNISVVVMHVEICPVIGECNGAKKILHYKAIEYEIFINNPNHVKHTTMPKITQLYS